MKHLSNLLVDGDKVTAINTVIRDEPDDDPADGTELATYEVTYPNQFRMVVAVVVTQNQAAITLHLFTDGNERVAHLTMIPGGIDQDHQLDYEGDIYRLTIDRRSTDELTDMAADKYVAQGGVRCPHCGSDEITQGRIQTDAGTAWCRSACDACRAEFRDNYTLDGVTSESRPSQHVDETDL